jgi:glyoxylase-like metal-dependent hydrolase (beta-lactamase superfamily II)
MFRNSWARRDVMAIASVVVLMAAFMSFSGVCLAQSPTPNKAEALGLRLIVPGVYLYKDTCNVYAIVKGEDAILIDIGSGEILEKLSAIGVRHIGWVLHTHFHRDQTQGDHLAQARGVKIAVPADERKYFENVESLWNEKKVFDLYDMRNEFFAPRENIKVDAELLGRFTSGSSSPSDSMFSWHGIDVKVIKTPGHTQGSVSFLWETSGKRLLFCGDLVASAGKIPSMHDLEWTYVGTTGITAE